MKLDIETIDEIVKLYGKGQLVPAIKALRAATDMGPKEAKDMVVGVGVRKTPDQLKLDLLALLPAARRDQLTVIWAEMQQLVARFDELVARAAELADDLDLGHPSNDDDRIARAKTDWRYIKVGDQVAWNGGWHTVIEVKPAHYDGDMPILVGRGIPYWLVLGEWTDVRAAS